MDRDELKRLQSYRGFPALSLRLPTHRRMPEAQQDPTRLKNMIRRAEQALKEAGAGAAFIHQAVERLEQFHRKLDYRHLDEGLCIFLAPDQFHSVLLPESVPESVVVADNFLTRDLVRMLNRRPHYQVLLLSEKATRWFSGWGRHLSEEESAAFPMGNDAVPDQPAARFARGVDPKRLGNERLKVFLRRVAGEVQSRRQGSGLPLFLLGAERLRAFYMEVAGAEGVAGQVEGNPGRAGLHELAQALAPALEKFQLGRRQEVLERFQTVTGTRHGGIGLQEVGKAAAMGRVETLLVEEAYAVPGDFDRSTGVARLEDGGGPAPGDVVDEIVETVLERGGQVFFFGAGHLEAAGAPLGAILRF